MTSEKVNSTNVSLILGRVFDEEVDAIVLVSNTKLKLGQHDAVNIRLFASSSFSKDDSEANRFRRRSTRSSCRNLVVSGQAKSSIPTAAMYHMNIPKIMKTDFDYILYAVLPSYCDSSTLMIPSQIEQKEEEFRPPSSSKDSWKHAQTVYQIYMSSSGNHAEKQERQQIFECLINVLNKVRAKSPPSVF